MNAAILLAGGTGNRAQSSIPKQFVCAGGRMMVTHALIPLLQSKWVDAVWIVAAEEWREPIRIDIAMIGIPVKKPVDFVNPGESRQASIMNGMDAVLAENGAFEKEDTVLIQDAARPFATAKLLGRCYQAYAGHDGILPYLPMKDAVYLRKEGCVIGRMDRNTIVAGQAPELYGLEKYYKANTRLLPEERAHICGAAEPAIMAGMDIVLIPGDEANFKVTTRSDMEKYIGSF